MALCYTTLSGNRSIRRNKKRTHYEYVYLFFLLSHTNGHTYIPNVYRWKYIFIDGTLLSGNRKIFYLNIDKSLQQEKQAKYTRNTKLSCNMKHNNGKNNNESKYFISLVIFLRRSALHRPIHLNFNLSFARKYIDKFHILGVIENDRRCKKTNLRLNWTKVNS